MTAIIRFRERHLLLPRMLAALVYGHIAGLWLKGFGITVLWSTIKTLFSRRDRV
jgi:hypothetical protein